MSEEQSRKTFEAKWPRSAERGAPGGHAGWTAGPPAPQSGIIN